MVTRSLLRRFYRDLVDIVYFGPLHPSSTNSSKMVRKCMVSSPHVGCVLTQSLSCTRYLLSISPCVLRILCREDLTPLGSIALLAPGQVRATLFSVQCLYNPTATSTTAQHYFSNDFYHLSQV